MSVESTIFAIAYTDDGVTNAWAIPFYFFAFGDLVVTYTPSGGSPSIVPMSAAGWEGSSNGAVNSPDSYGAYAGGGTLNFQSGFSASRSAGATISIVRATARIQPDSYPTYGPLPSTIIEHDFDRLTLIAQEVEGGFIGTFAAPPATGMPGQWFIVSPPVAGGPWGYVCTAGPPSVTWNAISDIGL